MVESSTTVAYVQQICGSGVLLVKGNYGLAGGPETLIASLARHINHGRFAPELVVLRRDGIPESPLLSAERLPIERTDLRWSGLLAAPAIAMRLRRLISERRACIIHTHDMRANLVAWLVTRVQPIPWIAHVHGWLGPTQTGKWRLYERLDRRFVRAANLVLVGSCAAKKDVEAAGVRSVTVLPNAIEIPPIGALSDGAAEVRSMLRIDSNAVTVGIVGRVHPGKGHRFLLQAIAKLRKEGLNVEGIVVGEGPDLENLRSNARESGIAQVVHFPGFCSDAAPYVNAMDIFVAPSLKESMPLTVLEAMAARRAVVASRVGDIPSVLEHGYDGWLVTPGDSDDLTDAIKVLVRDPALRARMGERARRKIEEQFSAETMSRRLEEIYASLLGKKVQTA